MPRRLDKTLVDYLVIAISPALIMTLVGSLVLFLIEVFYQGNFQGRLEYIFALFVIGAVLVGRISIESGREHAALFALPLGGVTLVAINRFVEFQGGVPASLSFVINCGLIALVWWSADKLTWDCTLIDEGEEDSGEGLLEAVGLDRSGKGDRHLLCEAPRGPFRQKVPVPFSGAHPLPPFAEIGEGVGGEGGERPKPESGSSLIPHPSSHILFRHWWQRFVEHRRRPHAPGAWVVYFSLAALPLFGLGQLLIPASALPARQSAFQLLCIYVASGLGLLLSTSFLGLRRYLRQRRREMPAAMAGRWLCVGGLLIVGVMLVAMLLPRPNAEYAISDLPFRVGSPDQTSSRYGVGRDGVEENQPWARAQQRDSRSTGFQPVENTRSTDQPESKDGQDGRATPASGEQKGKSGEEKGASNGASKGGSHEGKRAAADEKGQSADKQTSAGQDGKGTGHEPPDRPKPPPESTRSDGGRPEDGQAKEAQQPKAGEDPQKKASAAGGSGSESSGNARPQQPPAHGPGSSGNQPVRILPHFRPPADVPALLAGLFKWLFYAALVLLAGFLIWKNRAELWSALSRFIERLSDFWHGLFGRRGRRADRTAEADGPKNAPQRFADFADPFATGMAQRCPPEVLVQYSFEAFEAWARDRGHPRCGNETPHEFVRLIVSHVAALTDDAAQLADLYCQVAYSPRTLSPAATVGLSHLWQTMNETADAAVLPA